MKLECECGEGPGSWKPRVAIPLAVPVADLCRPFVTLSHLFLRSSKWLLCSCVFPNPLWTNLLYNGLWFGLTLSCLSYVQGGAAQSAALSPFDEMFRGLFGILQEIITEVALKAHDLRWRSHICRSVSVFGTKKQLRTTWDLLSNPKCKKL